MKNLNYLLVLLTGVALVLIGCEQEPLITPSSDNSISTKASGELSDAKHDNNISSRTGATQISGLGIFAEVADCDFISQGADFALLLSGDLVGCLYVTVLISDCSPSGTYREEGTEYFVGTYNGEEEDGTFRTNYKFEAKFEGCEDGGFLGAEIFGRCQHPIVNGSGDGVFAGVKGRLDFKDDIETGTFPYRGHL